MKMVFADTSYFVAQLDPKDVNYEVASQAARRLGPVKLVTSEMVLTELLNFFSGHGEHARKSAVNLCDWLRGSFNVEVVPQTSELFGSAMALYRRRGDKMWSLTDCASHHIMSGLGITDALTHDLHFRQMGFNPLMRSLE